MLIKINEDIKKLKLQIYNYDSTNEANPVNHNNNENQIKNSFFLNEENKNLGEIIKTSNNGLFLIVEDQHIYEIIKRKDLIFEEFIKNDLKCYSNPLNCKKVEILNNEENNGIVSQSNHGDIDVDISFGSELDINTQIMDTLNDISEIIK